MRMKGQNAKMFENPNGFILSIQSGKLPLNIYSKDKLQVSSLKQNVRLLIQTKQQRYLYTMLSI